MSKDTGLAGKPSRTAIEQTERVRNALAFLLVGAFISCLPVFCFKAIPDGNKDIVVYMVGQLSGMALMALGFYFVNKVGQDALDATRSATSGKMAEAVTKALDAGKPDPDVMLKPGETAQAEEKT